IFFFSSRRRHTRCYRDWSSDVCSSDLEANVAICDMAGTNVNPDVMLGSDVPDGTRVTVNTSRIADGDIGFVINFNGAGSVPPVKIGRASCREREEIWVGEG